MPLLLNRSAFLHIPKTGGTWVRNVLSEMGLVRRLLLYRDPALSIEGVVPSHHTIIKDEDRPAVVFAFVRHPLTWYRSYWAWKSRMFAWNPYNPLDRSCASADFETFVRNVIEVYPDGYLTRAYPFFLRHCTHAGRFEFLATDLMKILDLAGEPYDAEFIHGFPRQLCSAEHSRHLRYPADLAFKLMKIEGKICQKLGYQLADHLLE